MPHCAHAYVREFNVNTLSSPLAPPFSLPEIDGFSKTPQEMRQSSFPYMMDERVQLAQLFYPNNDKDLGHRDQGENYQPAQGYPV